MIFCLVASYAESLINFRGPLISALRSRGVVVHVIAPDVDSLIRSRLLDLGAIVHEISLKRTGTSIAQDVGYLIQLRRILKQIKPDILLCYTVKPVIYGMIAGGMCRVAKRYALITGLGYAFQEESDGGFVSALVPWLYKQALSFSHKVFFQNPDDESLFRTRGLIGKDKSSFVVNGSGVDISYFQVNELPKVGINFLLIARLLGAKGVREYVEASRQIRNKYKNATFELVGPVDINPDSIKTEELDEWVKEGVIIYSGAMKDVRTALARCNVYVLPSYREGTPRSVLEAMAMGRPVITTDTPGCRETVVPGKNGFLVPAKSVPELVLAMSKFLEHPELVWTMGKISREMAEEKYDVNKVNDVMIREMNI